MDPGIVESLRNYKATSKLQTAALAIIVKHTSVKELKDLKQAFVYYDTSQTGFLSFEELKNALESSEISIPHEEIEAVFQNADVKGDGRINYSEFIAATMQSRVSIDKQLIWSTFKKFDVDNSGTITLENL